MSCSFLVHQLFKRSVKYTRYADFRQQHKSFGHRGSGFSSSIKSQGQFVAAPPENLLRALTVPQKLLMGPGPSNCSPRVLAAGALPMLGHLYGEFIQIMDDVKAGLQYAFQTRNEWTFAISGTGHAAMEATVLNLLEPGEVALVCQNGFWSQRFALMVENNDAVAKTLVRPMGEVFSLEDIEQALKKHKPGLVFIIYGESSGGTAQPLEGLGHLCHRYNALLVVDAVAILGGAPLFMDDSDIDVLYAGTQKGLSAPPSLSPISFSQRARDKILNRKTRIRSHYFNAIGLANHWGCEGKARGYHHTEMITSVYMLRESLAILAEKGLEASWGDHRECAELLYDGITKMGLELLVKDKNTRNPCVTPIKVPAGASRKDVSDYAMAHYRVDIPGGLGDQAGEVWRVGIMGYNSTPDNIKLVLRAFGEALNNVRSK